MLVVVRRPHRALIPLALAGLIVPLVASGAVRSHSIPTFHAPGKTVYCKLLASLEPDPSDPPAELQCWRPRDGRTVWMLSFTGRARTAVEAPRRGDHRVSPRKLALGKTWSARRDSDGTYTERIGRVIPRADYRCTSEKAGIRCKNRGGHGWFIGAKRGHRLF